MAVAWHDTRQSVHSWSDGASNASGGFGTGSPPDLIWPNLSLRDNPQGRHSNAHGLFGSWFNDEFMASGAGVPFLELGLNGNTPWGDYESMAADPFTSSFYPVWADQRTLSVATNCPNQSSTSCNSLLATTQWVPFP